MLRQAEKKKKTKCSVRSGIWTHALSRGPELESGALDHSAILTLDVKKWDKLFSY